MSGSLTVEDADKLMNLAYNKGVEDSLKVLHDASVSLIAEVAPVGWVELTNAYISRLESLKREVTV